MFHPTRTLNMNLPSSALSASSLVSSFFWTILTTLTILTLTHPASTLTATSLKHSFVANHDNRFFIGPIGTPYGFLEHGVYNLQVSKFRIHSSSPTSTSKSKSIKNAELTAAELMEETQDLHPGFLLKRFDTENEFTKFMNEILDNPTQCGFEELMNELDENFEVDNAFFHNHTDTTSENSSSVEDETVARGPGVVDGGPLGIFLSMNHAKMWKPNTPEIHHTFTLDEAGYYFLFYQICFDPETSENEDKRGKYLFREVKSTFHLNYEYMNLDAMGKNSYLTSGEMPLPHLYLYFTVSYALMLLLWVRSLKGDGSFGDNGNGNGSSGNGNGKRVTVYAIHHLMSAVLGLKTISTFFESVRYHFIRVNGHAELWSFLYYGFTFVKSTFLFTVILLLGSGWSFFKPFLTPKERRVIFFVFILQVIDNIAVVVLTHETMGERLYEDWSAVLHLVDIVSCCAILIPIVWQVNSLEQSLEQHEPSSDDGDGDGDGNANANHDKHVAQEGGIELDSESTRLHEKLALFRFFYLTVVAYIYFTRIVVYLIASSLSYNHTWWRYLISEVGTLLFYVTIGMKFKPKAESEYSSVLQSVDFENGVSSSSTSKQNNIELGTVSAPGKAASKLQD